MLEEKACSVIFLLNSLAPEVLVSVTEILLMLVVVPAAAALNGV